MEKDTLIKELLSELSYRSNEGYPMLDNREQISILAEILDEWGYAEIKNELIQNLLEADGETFTATSKKSGETGVFKSKDNRDAAIEKGTHTKKEDSEEDDSKENPKTAVSPGTSSGDSYNDSLSDNDPAKIKKSKTSKVKKSPNVTNKIYGKSGEGDTDVKNDMMKYGFSGYQKGTGKKPAPGSAGSAFNEIASGEAVHMIGENPNINEAELARKMYEEYKETELGKEQSKSSGVGKIPKDIENEKLYSKCVISARSARTKYNTTQNRVNNLQSNGKFGTIDKIDTYYGAADSITAQTISINDANKVLLPNGTEVSKEDAVNL